MENLTEAAFRRAETRGQEMLETEPRAESASYDRQTGQVVLSLVNGCTYMFPASLVEELHDAAPGDLSVVEVEGHGFNLRWPGLDVDLYVPALLAGVFGTRSWMTSALARQAGRSTSPAKAAAARANGAKGGRPSKQRRSAYSAA